MEEEIVNEVPTEEVQEDTVETLTQHVEALTNSLDILNEKKDYFEKQVVLNKEKQLIMEAGFKPLKPTMEYEQNDRFWEIMLEELQYKHRMVNYGDDKKIEEMERQITETEGFLVEATEKLQKLTGEKDE